jgi:hypothetical protein
MIKDIAELKNKLKILKYTNFKDMTSKSLAILSNANRISILQQLAKDLKTDGAIYNDRPSSDSSIGKLEVQGFKIYVKPLSKQGSSSAGLANEKILATNVNDVVKQGACDVIFMHGSNKFVVKEVIRADLVGTDTTHKKKSDLNLVTRDGKTIPISIKQDNAEIWESADNWASNAKKIVDDQVAKKNSEIQLTNENGIYSVSPNFAVVANSEEVKSVVFGSDILSEKGAIISRTFVPADFKYDGLTNTLTVNVSGIIRTEKDIPEEKKVYFLIRNDRTRNIRGFYRGLRVLAVYKKRLTKNVLVLKDVKR